MSTTTTAAALHSLRKTRPLLSRTISSHISQPPPSSTIPNHYHHYLTTLLQTCKTIRTLLQIHTHLITSGLPLTTTLTTRLINLYSSFQKPHISLLLFTSTPNPPPILYNSMIKAYTRSNQHHHALSLYLRMVENSVSPDNYTFTFVIKACTGAFDMTMGVLVHREIVRRGLECDAFIGAGLVDMYCKMGDLVLAKEVFDKIPNRDVVAWNAMIAGLSQSFNPREAVELFRCMQFVDGVEVSKVSLLNLFPAVCKLSDVRLCKCAHGYVLRRELGGLVLNGLIDVYSKCRRVDIGYRIFELMRGRDDVSWGTIMAGYEYNGRYWEVLELFDQLKREDQKMNLVSVVSALMAAAEMRDLKKGREIHECAIWNKMDSDIRVATPLVIMYTKCGELEKAKDLFGRLQEKDVVAWSALIAAFAQSGYPEEAVSLFGDMQVENLKLNEATLVGILPACAELKFAKLGMSLHCYVLKTALDSDSAIATSLVSMYAKCGCFTSALIIFDMMPHKEVVTWNALISAYVQAGDTDCALKTFCQLQLLGVHPDPATMVSVVSASSLSGDLGQGKNIHGQIIKYGFESDCYMRNALIDMYAKSGSLASAELLFTKTMTCKDVVFWNVMISGYMHNRHARKAISVFKQMKIEAFLPNLVTIVSILPAAACIAAINEGTEIHAYIVHMGFHSNALVGNSLIDMYSKCGRLDSAERIFNEMENKDTVSWNAMLAGYAVNGHGHRAVEFFSYMQEGLVEVDHVSVLSVLSACRHSGLVEEGKRIFNLTREKHHIEPNLEHYACMVDLLGRAGLFEETLALIDTLPMKADAAVWGALLAACTMHSNVELAEVALSHLVKLEPWNPAHYVVLSGIYAQSDRWVDSRNMRIKIKDTGSNKTPGCSWLGEKQEHCISNRRAQLAGI